MCYLYLASSCTCPRESTSLFCISGPAGSAIAESKPRSLSRVTTLLCSGASVEERAPDQRQNSRVALCLQQETPDSFVQTSPPPSVNHSTYALKVPWLMAATMLRWGLENSLFFAVVLYWWWCCGFSLVTHVVIVTLLNALNVNVVAPPVVTPAPQFENHWVSLSLCSSAGQKQHMKDNRAPTNDYFLD